MKDKIGSEKAEVSDATATASESAAPVGASAPTVESVKVEAAGDREKSADLLQVEGQSRRSASPFQREKSPFELGDKRNLQVSSVKAIIDKALIMDISGGITNVDEYIQLFFNEYCIIDQATCSDVSPASVKIIVVEEDDDDRVPLSIKPMDLDEPENPETKTESGTDAATEDVLKTDAEKADQERIDNDSGVNKASDTEPVPKTENVEIPTESGQPEDEINKTDNENANLESTLQDDAAVDDSDKLKLDEESSEDEMIEEEIDPSLWQVVTGEEYEPEIDTSYQPRIKKALPEKSEKEKDQEWQRQRHTSRPPMFLSQLTDRSVAVGSSVKFTCSVSGPEVSAKWFKDNKDLERSQKMQYRAADGMQILEITSIDHRDVGVYTCVVKNKNGELSTSARLSVFDNVEDKPTPPVMVSIRDYFHVYLNALIVECHVNGSPRPMVRWFKDDEEIVEDKRTQITHEGADLFQLIITHPEAEESGVYTCKADNGIGVVQISHTVNFVPIPKRKNKYEEEALEGGERRAPAVVRPVKREPYVEQSFVIRDSKNKLQFDAQFNNRTAYVGSSVKFICSVSGPQPTYKWTKNEKPLEWTAKVKNLTRECIGEIEITDLSMADAGVYTCTVKNPHGTIATSATLTVMKAHDSDYTPPTFTRALKETYSILEDDLVLEVHVRGVPAPEIKWFKDMEQIFAFERYQISREADGCWKLSIHNPDAEDSGKYMCHAINVAGKAKVSHVVDFKSKKEMARVPGIYKADHKIRKYDENDDVIASRLGSRHSTRENSANPGNPANGVSEEETKRILAPSNRPRRSSRRSRYDGPSEPYVIRDSKQKLHFDAQLKDLTALVGTTVKLLCSVSGPGPTFKWFKNDKPLVWSPKLKNLSKDGFGGVAILGATLEDSGVYKCLVKNGHSDLETRSNLKIFANPASGSVAPSISRVSDYYNIQVDDLIIEAHIRGVPNPTIKWFRDGVELKHSDKYFVMREPDGVFKLCIHEPDRMDGGRYVIQAKNSVGKEQCKHFVTFLGKEKYAHVAGIYHADPKVARVEEEPEEVESTPVPVPVAEAPTEDENGEPIEPKKPKDPKRWERDDRALVSQEPILIRDSKNRLTLDAQLRDRIVSEGSNVKLLVSIGGPGPTLRWYRNNIPLVWSKTVKNLTREGFGGIQLFNVNESDSAVYKCVAKNSFNELETSCRLTVFSNPNLTAVAPTFTRNVKEYYNMQVNDLILEFHVRGTPTPKVKWFKDCIEIEEWDHFFVLREPDGVYKFTIHNPTRADTGRYVCQAENSAGKVTMRHDINRFNKEDYVHVHGISYSDPTVFSQYLEDEREREIENEKQRLIDKEKRLVDFRIKKAKEEAERLEAERLEEERLAREAAGEDEDDEDGEEEEEEATYETYGTYGTSEPAVEIPVFYSDDEDDPEGKNKAKEETTETAVETAETAEVEPEAPVEEAPVAEIVPEVAPIEEPVVVEEVVAEPVEPEPEVIPETEAEKEARRQLRLVNLMSPKKPQPGEGTEQMVDPKYQLSFIASLKDRTAIEGTQFKLFCSVCGPRPDIKFFKNNIPLVYGPKCKNVTRESLGGVMFPSIVPEDSGVYSCVVKNQHCEISCAAKLTVIPKPKPKGEPLRFPRGVKESYNLATDELILETYITGDIRPHITWYKDCREVENGDKYFIGRDGNLHRLHVSKPTTRDSGTYMCKAENDHGAQTIKYNVNFGGKEEHFHLHGVYHADSKEKIKMIEELLSMPKPEPEPEEMVEMEVDMEIEVEVTDSEHEEDEDDDEDEDEEKEEDEEEEEEPVAVQPEEVKVEEETVGEKTEETAEEKDKEVEGEEAKPEEPTEPVVPEKIKKMKKVKKMVKVMRFVKVEKPEPVVEAVPEPEVVPEEEPPKAEEAAEGAEEGAEAETEAAPVVDTKPKRNRNLPTDPVAPEPKVKLEFISRLLNRIVQKGKNIKLSCCASNANKIEVTWTKNGVPLEFGARCRNSVSKEGFCILELLKTTVADTGRYRCTVKTTEGEAFNECDVTVFEVEAPTATLVPPTFIVAPQDTYHKATNELILECRVRGNPKPTVEWIRDGCFIVANEKYEFFNQEDGTCQLIINNPGKYSDSGKYTIAAQNCVAKVEVSHNVVFEGRKEDKKKVRCDIKLENDVRPRAAPKPEPVPVEDVEGDDKEKGEDDEDAEETEEE